MAKVVKYILEAPYIFSWISTPFLALWTNNNLEESKIELILKQFNADLPPPEPPDLLYQLSCSCPCPRCMIINENSTHFVVGKGASQILVSVQDMLKNLQQSNGEIKGIKGLSV